MLQLCKEPTARQTIALSWVFLAMLFSFPVVMLQGEPVAKAMTASALQTVEEPTLPITRPIQTQTTARDKGRAVRLLEQDGSISELTMDEYLWRVVAAEMPASFESEALKAQVCAARTYTVRQQSSPKHENADICTDSHCCQAYIAPGDVELRWGLNAGTYSEKIARAVAETDGLGILYEGTPIQALFFSSANGKTSDAVEVWGNHVDYLRSVESPEGEEVPNYRTQVVLSADEVRKVVFAAYPGANLSGDPSGWFSNLRPGAGGAVASALVGGVTLTGQQVRALFGLRSPAFAVNWDGAQFTFSVTGYGHGVGMSQYGANKMAQEGENFRAILSWYYTGTEIDYLW